MPLDLVLRNARVHGRGSATVDLATFDIGIAGGKIVEIGQIATDAPGEDVGGRLVTAGFVETHIHLDKSCILERCHAENGTLQEAIAQVAAAKRAFSEADVYERGRRTLEKADVRGTRRMRPHAEGDARTRLRSLTGLPHAP